jgi:hypothetical protein
MMTALYNAVPTVATGDSWSAANHNTYVRANLADHEERVLSLEAGSSVISGRQGGNTEDWQISGTTNYAPAAAKIQTGSSIVTLTSSTNGTSATITFPVAFSGKPVIFARIYGVNSGTFAIIGSDIAITALAADSFKIIVYSAANTTAEVVVNWLAIGE